MPNFTAYNVDVDLDIDVDDFLSECSSKEIKLLINTLIEDGHLNKNPLVLDPKSKLSAAEEEYINKLHTISSKYYLMSEEELDRKIKELSDVGQ
mgnify:CR=1 FL=1